MNNVLEDQDLKRVLVYLRELYAKMLPALAAVETLLDIPEDERYVSVSWLAGGDDAALESGFTSQSLSAEE